MWAEAFVPSFIEVLPLISAFLMQFKIKEMKGKAACERLYKQDSRGALKGGFVRGFGRLSPEREKPEARLSGRPEVPGQRELGISHSPIKPPTHSGPVLIQREPIPGLSRRWDAGLKAAVF